MYTYVNAQYGDGVNAHVGMVCNARTAALPQSSYLHFGQRCISAAA